MSKTGRIIVFTGIALVLVLAVGVGLRSYSRVLAQGGATPENWQSGLAALEAGPVAQGGGTDNLAPGQTTEGAAAIAALPNGQISYQGYLLLNGRPYNGTLNITFRLYTAPSGGGAFWTETRSVQVTNGLFNVMLGAVNPLTKLAVDFQSQVYLGIQPAGAASELTPREPLGAVGYAMNLMPGATLVDTTSPGGYSYSLWVHSYNHEGIYGQADYTNTKGLTGIATGFEGIGVYGYDTANTNCPVGDTRCGAGVYGTASGDAYGGMFYGQNRSGIIVNGDATGFWDVFLHNNNGTGYGGISTNGAGYFGGYVTFGGGKSGYVVDIARNDGKEPLERGDVVMISGVDAAIVGDIPVIKVKKVTDANATGVVGVVDVLYKLCDKPEAALQTGEKCGGFQPGVTIIQPGQYLSVVTMGAYAYMKVDASPGPIKPGDLLAASPNAGHAAKAAQLSVSGTNFYAPGTVVGKALGGLESGVGVIPVFISIK